MATKRAQAGLATAGRTTFGDDELVCLFDVLCNIATVSPLCSRIVSSSLVIYFSFRKLMCTEKLYKL